MINQTIKNAIKENSAEMIQIRRKLHSEPELSWEEFETSQFVYDYLTKLGIEVRKTEPTGVIGELKGGQQGKTVALRADMDALSVEELNSDLSYKSKVHGKMHACGHDVHTAMLLSAAKALVSVKEDIPGTVRFIFQPAEEVATGAKAMVEQGAVEGVDDVFGIHIWSQAATGAVACSPGPAFASADIFKVHFKGRGGHGAMPQACIDAAIIASSFVMNVQSVVSRTVDPMQSAVVTIGKMVVGTRFNIIAENAEIEGTVRCFDPAIRDHIEKQLQVYANHTAAIYGGTAEVEYIRGTQAVINGTESAKLVQEVAIEAFGENALYVEEPTMGGEDFSFYLDEVPGSFALVGSGNTEKDTQWAHHHGKFNVDEDSMTVGAELYAQYAWSFLTK
ncbi:carboxypeptidase [Planococcus sp. PAMC 21323]|uniref:amidohydrolase n=1 Tax=Planococcus sp. PAMC 21323 TaxID=1526927 RepID=UPI000570AC78|nr:amidohydrolase [Planococcus sp. PAMC 21323]AIY06133.1 carboxypeptidase [Planococcus sp. PAMC 21323]